MFTIEKSIVINRPQQDVFDFASDPAHAHKWLKVVKSKEWISAGPNGVGSTQRVVARYMGRNMEATNEYTVWDPPNQNVFKTLNSPLRIEEGLKFEPIGSSTKVTWSMHLETNGIFRLFEGLFKRQAESQAVTNLEGLKRLLEASNI
jgi:carbon monoxide dehydrogenase subunit G